MNISTATTIFSQSHTNYLKYPKARKILENVLKNPHVLDNPKSNTCKQLNKILVKDLKNIEKSSKVKIFFLKIKLKFTSIFDCCTKNTAKRKRALAIISSKAKKILLKSENSSSQTTHQSKKSKLSKHPSVSSNAKNKTGHAKTPSRNSEAPVEDESSSSSSYPTRRFSGSSQDMSISNEDHLIHKEIELGTFEGISSFKTFIEGLKNFENHIEEIGVEAFKYLPTDSHIRLEQSYQNHQICNQLVSMTKRLESASASIKNGWEKYLKELKKNTLLTYPDQTNQKLKTSVAVKLLHNEKAKIYVEKLEKFSNKDILQIGKVERDSFSSHDLIMSAKYDHFGHMKSIMKAVENNNFYVARDKSRNNKIVGVLQFSEFQKLIFSISRRAMYAQCNVGPLLWEIFSKEVSILPLTLYVRESNPAVRLYESWGFKEVSKLRNFYQQPQEASLRMQKDI